MRSMDQELAQRLRAIEDQQLRRELVPPQGLDFSSNDYLGLSGEPSLRAVILERLQATDRYPFSSSASRLLRGNSAAHQAVEERLATFKGEAQALLFPSGYQANIGLLTTLVEPCDRVLSDAANHASIIDGLRLSGCKKVIFPHLSLEAIEEALKIPYPEGRTFLVTESLFSMDGDIAPLDAYAGLLETHGGHLIVDDAHATGVFGDSRGSGLTEHFQIEGRALSVTSTLGKALGLFGAFVVGSRNVIDYLVNRCRPFIYTTAVPPVLLTGLEVVLDVVAAQPQRRRQVCALADRLRRHFQQQHLDTLQSCGPIVPVLIGENEQATRVAHELQQQGFDLRAIRPPTVSAGTARLRISVHANHREKDIDRLATATVRALHSVRI